MDNLVPISRLEGDILIGKFRDLFVFWNLNTGTYLSFGSCIL